MTDSRPEITAKADGAKVVLGFKGVVVTVDPMRRIMNAHLSVDEAFALQCQLATAIETAASHKFAADLIAGGMGHLVTQTSTGWCCEGKPAIEAEATTSAGLRAILENEPVIMEAFRNATKPETWRDRERLL